MLNHQHFAVYSRHFSGDTILMWLFQNAYQNLKWGKEYLWSIFWRSCRSSTLLDLAYKLKELERPKNKINRWRQIRDLCHARGHMPFKGQLFLLRTLLQVDSYKLMSTLKPCIQVDFISLYWDRLAKGCTPHTYYFHVLK